MGKAVPKLIKRRAEELMNIHPEKFSTEFEKNKELLNELDLTLTKKNRNLLAGFLTRKVKAKEKESK